MKSNFLIKRDFDLPSSDILGNIKVEYLSKDNYNMHKNIVTQKNTKQQVAQNAAKLEENVQKANARMT